MARKDDMEGLVTKSGPVRGANGARKSASNANKALITRNLRIVYGEVASEPLPQQLLDLLDRIEAGEEKQ